MFKLVDAPAYMAIVQYAGTYCIAPPPGRAEIAPTRVTLPALQEGATRGASQCTYLVPSTFEERKQTSRDGRYICAYM